MRSVLFLSVANSACSQMAEGIARALLPAGISVWSAGSRPTSVHPEAIAVLEEIGIDISGHRAKAVSAIPADQVDTVITLGSGDRCSQLLAEAEHVHWSLPDPAAVTLSDASRLAAFRSVRDDLRTRILAWLSADCCEVSSGASSEPDSQVSKTSPRHLPRISCYDLESSNAFVERFELAPYSSGALDGLCFAVKDNIEIRGRLTSYGSKPWREAHPPAAHHAVCVEQLLAAGARCVGKTVADEFTYSLDGESYFYGTPVNPRAPDRIPGGSSSGSASAVACGLVDFALGTDCGGSIRIPASLCGVLGMRPSVHRISEAGVLPFAPSVSTVGVLARDLSILRQAMRVLLRSQQVAPPPVRNVYRLEEAFAFADPAIREALSEHIQYLRGLPGITVTSVTLRDVTGLDLRLESCNQDALRVLQTAEVANCIGGWIEHHRPELGPSFRAAFRNVERFDRSAISDALNLCEALFTRVAAFTRAGDVFCYPTAPVLAPKKGTLTVNNLPTVLDYYDRTMAVTAFAGVARLPEVTVPLAQVDGIPIGLSLSAGHYQDEFLLEAVEHLWGSQPRPRLGAVCV